MPPQAGTKAHIATSTILMPSSGFDMAFSILPRLFRQGIAIKILYCDAWTEMANCVNMPRDQPDEGESE
jgi:hypothetical protein